jgi:hypothetical protein
MSKLEERESRRRSSVVGSIVDSAPAAASGKKGRPKEDRETKKRVSLSVLPSLYEDIQKIAYVQRRSVSDIMNELMEGYRSENVASISEFEVITKH